MSFFKRERASAVPTLETNEAELAAATPDIQPAAAHAAKFEDEVPPTAERNNRKSEWSPLARWFFNDIFYISMLLLTLGGVILRVPVDYWIIMTPIFGLISIIEGWSHFSTRNERLGLVFKVTAIWCAVLLSIYLFENNSVKGVMTVNGSALAIITLLALGTFVAGVQAHVWQICAVGGLLFLTVPGFGWLDNSPLLLGAATIVIIALGGMLWWIEESRAPGRDS